MKKILITLSLLLSLQGIARADSGWIYNSDTGHWYQRIDTLMTWQDAKTYAEGLGGYLATSTSQPENDFIYNTLYKDIVTGYPVWLGGSDEVQEGVWQWVTGETWSYTNWNLTQPDNYDGVQDYLVLTDLNGKWDDQGRSFEQTRPFIVESTTVVPEPISSILFIIGGATLIGRKYLKRKV
jgi:hypothetical protein